MAVSEAEITQRILRAMEQRQVRQADLARAIGMEASALSKALAATRRFGSLEVALIAEHLGISTDELLADQPNSRRVRVAARAEPGLGAVAAEAQELAHELAELDFLLVDAGYPSARPVHRWKVPAYGLAIDRGAELAARVRRDVGLGEIALPAGMEDLALLTEELLGINVHIAPLGRGIDGLALTTNSIQLVVISSTIAATRQRFTLAHEICHAICHDDSNLLIDEDVFGRRSDLSEIRANAFASAFLMPEALLKEAMRQGVDDQTIGDLLGELRVSLDALAYRLYNLELVDHSEFDRIRRLSSVEIAKRPGRTDDLQARGDRRVPAPLLDRAYEAFVAGDISIRPLANLLGADPDQLLDELTPPPVGPIDSDAPAYAL